MQVVINEPNICRLGLIVSLTAQCPKCGKPVDIVTIEGSRDVSVICHTCKLQDTLLGLSSAELKNRVFQHLANTKFAN